MARKHKSLEKSRYTSIYKDTTSRFAGIWHLLLRWHRSIYKLIWKELAFFLAAYFALSVLYRYVCSYALHKLWKQFGKLM